MAEITIGEYIFLRLKELGVGTIFGVPGDYELNLLDFVRPAGLQWIGTPNELVGAYAADGYARQKGCGAVVTTFGPGELSALCGLGGSYCEFVPVVHIVGYPSFAAQGSGKILHHTLGDKSYDHYIRMSSELSCATAVLKDPKTAPAEIDRVFEAVMFHSQTGYIGISEDVVMTKIPLSTLQSHPLNVTLDPGPQDDEAVAAIVAQLEAAKSPTIMLDGGAARGTWEPFVADLVDALPVPWFHTVMGKGLHSEDHPRYGGAYAGVGSTEETCKLVEDSDCILWLANMPSDFNTGIFTEHVKTSTIIDLQRFHVAIGSTKLQARIVTLLPKLAKAIEASPKLSALAQPPTLKPFLDTPPVEQAITQAWFWPRLTSYVRPGDLIVTETGTSQFGTLATKLPKGCSHWTQAVWGSIGYAIGAAVGASVAAKETGKYRRMLVFTGDGSLQLTVQAFSILNRHGIVPVVFVLNNKGYTVERYFNGWTAQYNDIPDWNYGQLFEAFAPESGVKTFKVRTGADMDKLLADEAFQNATYPQCVDYDMDIFDAPGALKDVFVEMQKSAKKA